MAQELLTKTKVSAGTKVAIGVALVAGGLAIANALVPLISFSVAMKAPANGATVAGSVELRAAASQTGIEVAAFQVLNGKGATVATLPAKMMRGGRTFAAMWDTKTVPDGKYGLRASASKDDKSAVSRQIGVTVNNAVTPPPTGSTCGNGQCESGETAASCAADCSTAPPPATNTPPTAYKPDGSTTPPSSPRTNAVISLNALPSTSLANGTMVMARFTVTAGAADNVSLKKLSFKVQSATSGTTTTMVVSSPALREVGQGFDFSAAADVRTSGSDCGFAASAGVRCVRITFAGEQVITAGTSKTFELRGTVSGTLLSGDILEASLLGDPSAGIGALSGAGTSLGLGGTQYNFIWSDNSAIPHSETSVDWWNGSRATGLPTGSHMLVRS